MKGTLVALFATAILAMPLQAQVAQGVRLEPAAHVRVSIAGGRERGDVISHDADSLRLRRGSSARGYAFRDIQRLEVRGGRDRRRGMLLGAGIVGGIGLVFGGIDAANGRISGGDYVGTVITNALAGAAVGVLISPRGWREIPLMRPVPSGP